MKIIVKFENEFQLTYIGSKINEIKQVVKYNNEVQKGKNERKEKKNKGRKDIRLDEHTK